MPDPTTAAGLAMSLADTSVQLNLNTNGVPTAGFGSLHQGGAHVGLTDGSIRFLNELLDSRVYRMMSDINDGLSTGGCSY